MRNEYDLVILGSGPTGLTLLDHFSRKNRHAKCLLISLNEAEQGAYSKGVKVVNPVISKLPQLRLKDIGKYEEIVKMKQLSEILLKEQFRPASAYLGDSCCGLRYCTSGQEFETLRSVKNFFRNAEISVTNYTASFLKEHLGKIIDKNLLFPYEEHLWDINKYIDIFLAKNGESLVSSADRVTYDGNSGSNVKLIVEIEGNRKVIFAGKLIVCLGIGNIDFERSIKIRQSNTNATTGYKVLAYYKRIYSHRQNLPQRLSSIIIPGDGICVTNELVGRNSIMYNTNSGFCAIDNFSQSFLNTELSNSRETISKLYPIIPREEHDDFMCSMLVDPEAYHNSPERHFRFIISHSVDENIRYFNLPYFTAIAMAAHSLPVSLNDL